MKRFFRLVGSLFLALLNATLLLALALAVVVFLVLNRIQDIGSGAQTLVRDTLTHQIVQFDTVKTRLEKIEDGVQNCAPAGELRQEIDGVRTQLTALDQGIQTVKSASPRDLAQEFLMELTALVQQRLSLPKAAASG